MVNRSTPAESDGQEGRGRRRRRTPSPARADLVAGVLLALTVAGSVLLIGAQHPEVLVPVALMAAGSALLLRPRKAPRLVWLLIGLAAYTMLQLVPLPFRWVEVLSPAAADVWRDSLDPLGEPRPGWVSLSVDPGATALEGVKWFGYACVLLAASAWREKRGGSSLATLVFVSALAVAVITLAHGLVGAERIYGLFIPNGEARWTRGPMVNANSLSGYLNLGLFAGVGVWLSSRENTWVKFMPLGFALLGLNVVLTGSRGGVGSLAIGAVVLVFLVMRQSRSDWLRTGAIVAGSLLVLLIVGISLAGPDVQAELTDRDLGAKVTAWRWALGLLGDFPVFGVGRGAFETAFQPYRQPLGRDWTTVFAHVENFPLQWLADWGAPVGLVATLGCLAAALGLVRRALRDPFAAAVTTGLGVLFLHNLVDVALEIFAVTAAALVAYAAVHSPPRSERAWQVRIGVACGGVLLSGFVVVLMGATPVKIERERLARDYNLFLKSRPRDAAPIVRRIRASIRQHPAEAYFPLMGALVARRTGQGEPLRWLARALERGPINGNTHIALAQVLAARGARQQAMIHVRLAARYDVVLRDYALGQAVSWARSTNELVAVFPRDLPGSELLDDLCEKARGEPLVGCWREAVSRRPRSAAKRSLAQALLDALEAGQAPCAAQARTRCADEVEGLLAGLAKSGEKAGAVLALQRARLLAHRGDPRAGAHSALDGCPASPEATECLARALEFAASSRDLPTLAAVGERYLALKCGEPAHCAAAHERIAATYVELGTLGTALVHFTAATKLEPTTERWIRDAEVAVRAGSSLTARLSLERAGRAGELNAAQRQRMAAVDRMLAAGPGLR